MVELALHGLVEVCVFLFFYLDCVIIPSRGGGFFPFSHKISSFFCFGPYYYAVSRKNFFRITFGFSRCCLTFLYKTFWDLYKTKYFLYKNRREFRHVFYLVGYDSLVSFPSVCLFLRILSIKNLFFQNEPSFLICIYSLFVWIFSYFFGCYGRFFCPVSYPFLHFSVRLRKNLLLFFIRIIRFLRFFRFVGIIFPAFSRVELRNFSARFDIFCASPEFFQKKNPLFGVSITQFRTCFS